MIWEILAGALFVFLLSALFGLFVGNAIRAVNPPNEYDEKDEACE